MFPATQRSGHSEGLWVCRALKPFSIELDPSRRMITRFFPAASLDVNTCAAQHRRQGRADQQIADSGKKIFDAVCAGGHEGVIAKRA